MAQTIDGAQASLDSTGRIPAEQLPLSEFRSDRRYVSTITATPAGAACEPGAYDIKATGTYRLRVQIDVYGAVTGTAYALFAETPAATAWKQLDIYGGSSTLIAAATELVRWTKSGGTAKTFTDTDVTIATDQIAIATHGYTTGWAMTLTSTGTPPAPLAASTVYYVISVSAGVIKLATTYENAIAGTAINLTDAGTPAATNTLTPKNIVTAEQSPVLEYAVDLSLTSGKFVRAVGAQNNMLVKIDAGTSVVCMLAAWMERTA